MISKELIEFLANPALAFIFGTRDEKLQPSVGRACGVKVNEGEGSITVFVPKTIIDPHISNLKSNGRLALTAIFPATHGSYQFKGIYLKHEDASESDHKMIEDRKTAFKDLLVAFYGPPAAVNYDTLIMQPAVAITFKAEDIFNQTPGVGAGQKIN